MLERGRERDQEGERESLSMEEREEGRERESTISDQKHEEEEGWNRFQPVVGGVAGAEGGGGGG